MSVHVTIWRTVEKLNGTTSTALFYSNITLPWSVTFESVKRCCLLNGGALELSSALVEVSYLREIHTALGQILAEIEGEGKGCPPQHPVEMWRTVHAGETFAVDDECHVHRWDVWKNEGWVRASDFDAHTVTQLYVKHLQGLADKKL